MVLDQTAPLLYAAAQIAVALLLALPALFFRSLRRPARLALLTAVVVFALVFTLVLTFDLVSSSGRPPLGTTLYIGALSGTIWGTIFFIVAYLPLALLAMLRRQRL
jgi:quinol-cytochrome oxidoreductase complex cytochrome b subunit